jgi:hypothetical protein
MAATYITDQKGRLLTSVFPAYRGDASIGGSEVIEVTVDLSQVGSGTTLANGLGVQSGLPNAGIGLSANDSIDVAVLPYNFQVQSVQFTYDLNAPTPDAVPVGNLTGLTGMPLSVGRYCVSSADRTSNITVATFTGSATTYASAVAVYTGSAYAAPQLLYTTGTDFLPYNTPGTNASVVTGTVQGLYVLRLTIGTLVGGSSTGVKSGKFRIRVGGIVYGI